MKYGIYSYDKGYWSSCGWSMNPASAQWMSKSEAELKLEQMRADGHFVSIHEKSKSLHGVSGVKSQV